MREPGGRTIGQAYASAALMFTVCLLMLVTTTAAVAQTKSGAITGTVTDPSGMPVPGATVEVLQEETKVVQKAATNATGEYTVPYLQAGPYTVTVTATGFPPFRVNGVEVETARTVRTDVRLQLSKQATTIEVSAEAVQLQTESSSVQSAVGERIIGAVPNATQNPFLYATLQAGVVPRAEMTQSQATQSFGIGFDGRRFSSAFNINGGTAFTNDLQLDGLSVMGAAWNEASVLPNTDSLQEVRVATNNYTAEYGRGQGVVVMSTKNGTNQFHGAIYGRERNEALNANSFYSNANRVTRDAFRVHDYGGSAGGRIIRDKLFFFTSFEALRHNDRPGWMLSVPTAAERQGDFSRSLLPGTDGQPVAAVIYDPNNVRQVAPDLYERAPYPSAIVPNPDSRVLNIYSIYKSPNRAPTDVYNHNNFFTTENRTFKRGSSNNRLDYNRGKHYLYANGGVSVGEINTPSPYGAGSPYFLAPTTNSSYGGTEPEYVADNNPYVQLGDTIVLSPTTLLDIRYGLTRIAMDFVSNKNNSLTSSDYLALGIPTSIQQVMPRFGAAPDISNLSWAQYNNKRERQTNQQLTGSLTKQLGKWSLKAGGEGRMYLTNYSGAQNEAAKYLGGGGGGCTAQYINAWGGLTAQDTDPAQKGFGLADMFTGCGGWLVAQLFSPSAAFSQKYFAVYSQNDWHPTSRLTVNLGLRWEVQPAPTDRFDRISGLDLTKTNAWGGKGIIAFAGKDGRGRGLWNNDYRNFGPRTGFAYRMKNDWVMRGGYGMSYVPNNTGWYDGGYAYGMGAFAWGAQVVPYGTNPNGSLVGHFWDAAASPLVPAVGPNSAAPEVYNPGFPMFNVSHEYPPRIQQFNLFLERQLTKTWFASLGYSGSRGSHIMQSRYPLQGTQNVPDSVLSTWKQTYIASNGVHNPAFDAVQNPLQPATGDLIQFPGTLGQRTIPQLLTYYPYLALTDISIQKDEGESSYDSLQLRARHMFSSGLFLDASYTWSKSLDTGYTELQDMQGFSNTTTYGSGTNGIDMLNAHNNRKLSYSDVPHRVVAMVTYELPFGKGRKFEIANRAGQAILGNWQLGSIITLQSGYPLAPSGAYDGSLDGRPNRVPGQPLVLPKSLQGWYDGRTTITLPDGRPYTPCANCFLKYNPDAFAGQIVTLANGRTNTDPYWVGNAAIDYGALRGPGRNNVDLTLTRDFPIRERLMLSFRANATNAFNHTQFSANSYDMSLGGTLAVASQGVSAGMPNTTSYGTHNMNTYDPRQVILELRLQF